MDIAAWLSELGLERYAEAFLENEVDARSLPHLTSDDLKEMGVTAIGHRRLLLQAIADLRDPGVIEPAPPPIDVGGSVADIGALQSEAERRPLTVMFCDLADSTALSTELDPEDLQDLIRAYQQRCTEIISAYGGFVAKYMGDGILVYFGYPKSLERNAERAVRTGLAIIEAMAQLNAELGRTRTAAIAVRIGIATGLVVVGEIIGEGVAQERTVIGEAPNVAARLQSVAPRNRIVIGGLTKEIVGDAFVYEDLGAHELKGFAGMVHVWAVVRLAEDVGEDAEGDAGQAPGQLPLVGRDEEVGLLRRAWQQTKEEGRGRAVLVVGEPGIGKSALVETLRAQVREEGLARIAFRCSPYHTGSALYPVIEHVRRLLHWQSDESPESRLEKLAALVAGTSLAPAEAVPLFASLLSLPLPDGRYPPLESSPEQLKQQTQDALIAWTLEDAERRPMLVLWEDLHWADPSTLELLGLLLDQAPTVPLLIVLTFRPDFLPSWPTRSHMTPIALTRLERPQIEAMISHLACGKTLPAEVVEHIVAKTDGVPLYVEELTKAILDSEVLRAEPNRFTLTGPLAAISIPAMLQESLMARLDRLPTVREVAQLGAVLGREFAYEMLRSLGVIAEPGLSEGLSRLVEAELLYQRSRPPNARYVFKHALVQDAAYQSLLKRTRQHYHRQVAELLESRFPELIESQPELLAHHHAEAGSASDAVTYLQRAGEKAVQRSANREAIVHLRRGLELLTSLPETPARAARELQLHTTLGPAVMAMQGYASPEAAAIYTRARDLARAPARASTSAPCCSASGCSTSCAAIFWWLEMSRRSCSNWASGSTIRGRACSGTMRWASACCTWARRLRPVVISRIFSRSMMSRPTSVSPSATGSRSALWQKPTSPGRSGSWDMRTKRFRSSVGPRPCWGRSAIRSRSLGHSISTRFRILYQRDFASVSRGARRNAEVGATGAGLGQRARFRAGVGGRDHPRRRGPGRPRSRRRRIEADPRRNRRLSSDRRSLPEYTSPRSPGRGPGSGRLAGRRSRGPGRGRRLRRALLPGRNSPAAGLAPAGAIRERLDRR